MALTAPSIPQAIDKQINKSKTEAVFRATCTSVNDTLAGGFTVGIKRAGQQNPDSVEYRYLGPAPTVGDDVLVFRVGDGYIVAGIDETVLDRIGTQGPLISNTVTETVLYSFTVPAYTAGGIASALELFFVLSFAGIANVTVRFKANGITLVTVLNNAPIGTTSYLVQSELLQNRGALNSQFIVNPSGGLFSGTLPTATVDTTALVLIEVTGELSIADPTVTMRLESARLERK